MTKQQREAIIEILEAFPMALAELETKWKTGSQNMIQNTMADMQEFLLNIQTILSEEKAEGLETDTLIEKMYVLLFELNQRLGNKKEPESLFDDLNRLAVLAAGNIRQMPCKFEILFLPYKVSMWDCMESIWEASNRDTNCVSYVVPIPFSERVGDSLLPQYEGNLFPENVPVIPYWEYDIAAHHPDVIVIHNPYDDYNLVTQVEGKYFSRELKKHTSLLVYVPYFIATPKIMPQSHIDLPVYRYADIIIVQDEEMKEAFPKEIGMEKLLAMGSPKIDRILREQKRREIIIEEELPKDWKRKIKGKKVFFYNVSLSGLLENRKNVLNKIQYILSKFESRNDSVLIWRPHPLLEATLKSMCPELYPEYMGIREKFRRSDFGILDESPDNIKSVVLADAYIGEDTSSMIHYFGVLGKPVYCLEWETTSEKSWEERRRLQSSYAHFGEKECIFNPYDLGQGPVLWKMDYTSGKLSYVQDVPGMEIELCAYRGMAYINEYQIFAPCAARDIYIYNKRTEQGLKIPLRNKCKDFLFSDVLAYDGKAYFIPSGYQAIVKLDPSSNEYTEYTEYMNQVSEGGRENEKFSWHTCTLLNETLYLAAAHLDKMVLFHIAEEKFDMIYPGGCKEGYVYAVSEGEIIWLTGRDGNLYKYDAICGKMEAVLLKWEEQERTGMCTIAGVREMVYIFNTKSNRAARLNKNNGIVDFFEINVEHGHSLAVLSVVEGRTIYLINMNENILFQYDSVNEGWKNWRCCFDKKETLEAEGTLISEKMVCSGIPYRISEKDFGVTEFIDYITNEGCSDSLEETETYKLVTPGMDGSSGSRIYRYIRERIKTL